MKYRKKPVVVEAMQWTGDNAKELEAWAGIKFNPIHPDDRGDDPDATAEVFVEANSIWAPIHTGEWIIKDRKGFYPCKEDIFAETYEPATTPTRGGEYIVRYNDPYNVGRPAGMLVGANNEKEAEEVARLWWGTTPIVVTSVEKA